MTITLTDDKKYILLATATSIGAINIIIAEIWQTSLSNFRESAKTTALIKHIGNYNAKLSLADDTKCD